CLRGGRATSGRAVAGPSDEEAKAQLCERWFSGHWPDGASSATASPDGSDAGSPAKQDRGTGAAHPANTRQAALEQAPRTHEKTSHTASPPLDAYRSLHIPEAKMR